MFLNFTLVLGGARSGKSAFAENLCKKFDDDLHYIATAQAFDDEMIAKIARHRQDRGSGWTTVEAPLELGAALTACPAEAPVLIDCLTLWLSNRLLALDDKAQLPDAALEDWCVDLLPALDRIGPTIAVSNEVGMGLVPDTKLGRVFRDLQGRLNQRLAVEAGTVIFVAAGLPIVLKGALPE